MEWNSVSAIFEARGESVGAESGGKNRRAFCMRMRESAERQ